MSRAVGQIDGVRYTRFIVMQFIIPYIILGNLSELINVYIRVLTNYVSILSNKFFKYVYLKILAERTEDASTSRNILRRLVCMYHVLYSSVCEISQWVRVYPDKLA